MGVLGNPDHERFCQAVHARILAGESRGAARTAAYREKIYKGAPAPDAALAPNARRLAGQKHIRARIAELQDFAAKLAGIDQSWLMVQLKEEAEALKGFNLDDYLGPADAEGNRYYDLGNVPREKLALLTELTIESSSEAGESKEDARREIRKVRLKGPNKTPERVAIFGLMARIGGFEAPKKIAATDPSGDNAAPLQVIEIVRFSDAKDKATA